MKISKLAIFVVFVCVSILLSACEMATPVSGNVAPNAKGTPVPIPDVAYVSPESDNSYHWASNSRVPVSTKIWTVKVRVNDEMTSRVEDKSTGSMTAYNGYAFASYRSWQEGKGVLPVIILSITPEFPKIWTGQTILLKTSDTKAMGLPNGAIAEFKCNQDVEVISPVIDYQTLTEERLTYELDDCRMTSPSYTIESELP
jgi:hypothetical protein